ncbi:MAG: LamG domain-containing protein [Acidobacteriota bacterium]|nr:LamG domain-containing protein [Acidobacteriota bacterium]
MKHPLLKTRNLFLFFTIILVVGLAAIAIRTQAAGSSQPESFGKTELQSQTTPNVGSSVLPNSNQKQNPGSTAARQEAVKLFSFVDENSLDNQQKLSLNDKRLSIAAVDQREIAINPAALNLDSLSFDSTNHLQIPLFNNEIFTAVRNEKEGFIRYGSAEFSWKGKIFAKKDNEDWSGDVVLTAKDGALSGLIYAPNGVYEIVPQENFRHVLVQLDHSLFPECSGSPTPPADKKPKEQVNFLEGMPGEQPATKLFEFDKSSNLNENLQPLSPQVDNGSQIDVMVVYSDDVRASLGGTAQAQAFAQQAVALTNTAYQNSGVTPRVRLVYAREISYDESPGTLDAALNWIDSEATVAADRNTYKADMVAFIVETGAANECGLAWGMDTVSSSFAPLAFSTSTRSCAVGNLSFPHELGHNQGADHNPEDGSPASSYAYPYAYGHYVNGSFRTVMAYANQCTSSCPRVPYFSNPSVNYNGQATGITNQRENTRVLNNTAATVANFRDSGGVNCSFTLNRSSDSWGGGGGNGSFDITTQSGCWWLAKSNDSWISITSGAGNGILGNGSVAYTAAANSSSNPRTGTITVAGQTFTITQNGLSCGSTLTPSSASVNDQSGTGSFTVSRDPACASWTAISTVSWITVTSGGSGTTGNGNVNYSVAANTSSSSRTGTISVSGGSTFTITQAGAPACSYSLSGYGKTFDSNAGTSNTSIFTNRSHCSWSAAVTSGAGWLTITGDNDGSGFGSVNFSVAANTSSASRAGTITVAGLTFTVRQAAANLPCTRYLNGLIHWYRGEMNANDSIGANNGTTEGVVSYVAGKSGQAMSFDGNDSVAIQRQIGDSFSIEFWMKTTSTGGGNESHWYQGAGLVDGEVPGVANDFGVSLGNGKVLFGTGSPDTTIRSTTTVNNGQWHHVVATRNRNTGTMRLFVNGQAVASGTGGTQSLTAPTQITLGKLQTSVSYFNGQLDEVKIYDFDLTSTEVNNLYAGCSGLPSLSINDISVNEGNSGTSNSSFTVSLSAASTQNVSVLYATQDVTATTGLDYTAMSGTLTIPAGQISGTINVPVIGDLTDEPNETFKVVLSGPTNATIADNEGIGTIIDDDSACSYSISPDSQTFTSSGGSSTITVTAPAGCGWTATNALNWVSITSGTSGSGNGNVTIAAQSNPSVNIRYGYINIAGIQFFVGQEGIPTYSISGTITYGITPANQTAKFVTGVVMSATGASSASVNSNSSGAYSFTGLIGGNYTVTPTKTTNVNGITAFDATLVLRCVAAGANCTLTANQRTAADSDGDINITAFDATQILRYVAANGSNANTGQAGRWKFVQPSRTYNPLSASVSNQNFTAFLIGEVDGDWAVPTALSEMENETIGYSGYLRPFNNLRFESAPRLKLLRTD